MSPAYSLAAPTKAASPLRHTIRAAYRADEAATVRSLLAQAEIPAPSLAATQQLAARLAQGVRAARTTAGGVDALMLEFSLDSREGVALMCLAEALLRVPDPATRDRLIRDKIGPGDWRAHVGRSPSLFVNAAAWGLLVTGQLVESRREGALEAALGSLLRKGGEPLIRKGVDLAMRLLGKQFVTGRTIDEAIANAREREARGYRYSYDMLGEAALTSEDAQRYVAAYEQAIDAIGAASGGAGVYAGPGVSIKLSALHPRYTRLQRGRVLDELLPRVAALALRARRHDIGFSIDAEEADRLELSLDLFECLAADPALAGWNGLGFVVQAYQKRAPPVIDWLIEVARRERRRLMLRLVKGAYWDSEIKRAQVDGLDGYPVFTRKAHTDVAYLACVRAMLSAPDAVYGQFASHNALTIAAVYTLAGSTDYEFQCLHGMGESVYDQIVGADKLDRACRIYAPVGSHETLLAYLVRRLLENGSNSSFVNRIVDPRVAIAELVADPVSQVRRSGASPHPRIPLPAALYGERKNSRGIDFSAEAALAELEAELAALPPRRRRAAARPRLGGGARRARRRGQSCRPRRGRRLRRRGGARRRRARRRRRRRRGHGLGANPGRRARGLPRARRRPARAGTLRADRPGGARSRQDASQRLGRSPRSRRFLPLLRRAGPARACRGHAARTDRRHRPLEFSARDLRRPGRRRTCRGQPGPGQAGRANAADRGRRGGAAASRRHPGRGAAAAPRPRRDRRCGAGRRCAHRRRALHRLDRGRAGHQPRARLAPGRPGADRRNRRPERDDRRQLRAARAGRNRRSLVRVRQRRPALLGAARALPAKRHCASGC